MEHTWLCCSFRLLEWPVPGKWRNVVIPDSCLTSNLSHFWKSYINFLNDVNWNVENHKILTPSLLLIQPHFFTMSSYFSDMSMYNEGQPRRLLQWWSIFPWNSNNDCKAILHLIPRGFLEPLKNASKNSHFLIIFPLDF